MPAGPKALGDLDDIWRYTAETWSLDQADTYIDELARSFETLAATPEMARERTEFDPPVRIHSHKSHMIIYTVDDDHVMVLRVLGGQQNWQAILQAISS
ncbi:type II toxin-antitoxin system RelE/ParE family toxin [Breoghania sp. L-A4]|uniref:type II toxin-antitoxin system RelE/ParE family toxin n=1 Tax=Breoghania sp. L-A4 TaxID=2304600 RepID=UPI000E359D9D|nr:type II toxin-antitoxin system RelE/ParE family toxin [Breoghania sp. L-A4]